jgi:hypothetical protein
MKQQYTNTVLCICIICILYYLIYKQYKTQYTYEIPFSSSIVFENEEDNCLDTEFETDFSYDSDADTETLYE